MEDEENQPQHQQALHFKTLAEQKYNSSNLKSALKYAKKAHHLSPTLEGLSEILTSFKILKTASKSPQDWYKILQTEPFSHINTIKKQYKKLALTLHPDKSQNSASEEAFKLVGEAFGVLSDKIKRRDYDTKLRMEMELDDRRRGGVVETFWTACSTCRLLHQFERRYLEHNLMCPSCRKSFKAVEISDNNGVKTRVSDRIRVRSVGDILSRVEREKIGGGSSNGLRSKRVESSKIGEENGIGLRSKRVENSKIGGSSSNGLRSKRVESSKIGGSSSNGLRSKRVESSNIGDSNGIGLRSRRVGSSKIGEENSNGLRSKMLERKRNLDRKDEKSNEESKRVKNEEETMTLAEMQALAKKKLQGGKLKSNEEREKEDKVKESEIEKQRGSKRSSRTLKSKEDVEVMAVDDSDFYDFDKDRVERSFKKGQVWAIYDDDDGMPRLYGLIDEVVSVYPFEVKMSWLDFQNNGNEGLISWEEMGFHISCGRFKVSRKTSVNHLNSFSHVMDCERAAREVYQMYPKKGSVWALYNENALDSEGRNLLVKDKRCYDIVVFLTSYSEIHGLSMGYLEKVDGFKTVFKRKETGGHAIKWLEKDDVRLFSHQIPARKLSGEEASGISRYCWELDPASLPPELLTIAWRR